MEVFILVFAGIIGVMTAEAAIYKVSEAKYKIKERVGDILFGLLFTIGWASFGSPYFWLFMEGVEVPLFAGFFFGVQYHNVATVWLFGLTYAGVWELLRILIDKVKAKAKK